MPHIFGSQLRIGYGSEWHLLQFLGRHRNMLNEKVLKQTGAESVNWLDYPCSNREKFFYSEWCGLDFLQNIVEIPYEWNSFWPQKGNQQNWDAVAQLKFGSKIEWLLVEAKAHTSELKSRCKAKKNGGLSQIQTAFNQTKAALDISDQHDWLSPYYQFCNRLAVLHFLNKNHIPARLLFVYFLGDQNPNTKSSPKNEGGWTFALTAMHEHIGLKRHSPLESRIHKMFLPTCQPDSRQLDDQ